MHLFFVTSTMLRSDFPLPRELTQREKLQGVCDAREENSKEREGKNDKGYRKQQLIWFLCEETSSESLIDVEIFH